MKPRDLILAGALLVALWVYGNCREAVGAKRALQNQQDHVDDSTHQANDRWKAQFAAREIQRESILAITDQRLRGARGEIARLRGRIAPQLDTTVVDSIAVQLAVRDSLIAQQDTVIAGLDIQVSIYRTMVADRDELIGRREREIVALTTARDNWRKVALKKLGCVGGVGVTVGLDGRAAVGVGATCGIRL